MKKFCDAIKEIGSKTNRIARVVIVGVLFCAMAVVVLLVLNNNGIIGGHPALEGAEAAPEIVDMTESTAPETTATPTPEPMAALLAGAAVEPTAEKSTVRECNYILNTNTMKFHYPDCPSVKQMNEANKESYFGTRNGAIALGYSPCGRCKP